MPPFWKKMGLDAACLARFTSALVIATMAALLVACGSGGSSGGSSSGGAGSTTSGQVALFLRDGPIDYDSVFVTIHEITLQSADDDSSFVLFSSATGLEVDLLDLEDEDLLLTLSPFVPAGSYRRIDLEVSNVHTVGGPCDTLEIRVPSGKLKLKTDEPFAIDAGQLTSIRLDMDAKKSLHLHPAGASGHCNFRPVVFIEVQPGAFEDRCQSNLTGDVLEFITDADGDLTGFYLELSEERGELQVAIDANTAYFDAEGLPTDDLSIDLGARYTVHGRLDDEGVFRASVVMDGLVLEVSGSVTSLDATTSTGTGGFDLEPGADSELVGVTPVATFDSTVLFFDCEPVDSSPVQVESEVRVSGKLAVAEGELRAAVVHVDPPRIEGAITTVTALAEGHEITIAPLDGSPERTIEVPVDVPFEVEAGGEVSAGLLTTLVSCAPRVAVVTLEATAATATSVELADEQREGEVEAIDAGGTEWIVAGETVEILPGAIVISVVDGTGSASLSDVGVGDPVRLFGLDACPAASVDFHATLILILPD